MWPSRRHKTTHVVLFLFVLVSIPISPRNIRAQGSTSRISCANSGERPNLDVRLLCRVYRADSSVLEHVFVGSDRMALPLMFGSVPTIWSSALLFGDFQEREQAFRMTLSWGLAAGTTKALKQLFRRDRPFRSVHGIEPRRQYPGGRHIDQYSYPSGHAAMTTSILTSLSLSYPKWYVIAPGILIVGTVSVSRVWMGVHYPSDVVSGIVLGIISATAGYYIGDSLVR